MTAAGKTDVADVSLQGTWVYSKKPAWFYRHCVRFSGDKLVSAQLRRRRRTDVAVSDHQTDLSIVKHGRIYRQHRFFWTGDKPVPAIAMMSRKNGCRVSEMESGIYGEIRQVSPVWLSAHGKR